MERLDYLLQGLGFFSAANGKATIVSPDLSSNHLRILAEVGLADCFYDPAHFEAVMVRRRRKSFPYGFHIISENETFSTKRESDISGLEEYAGRFSNGFLPVERHDLQHFQALSKRLLPDKLVKYLEAEVESPGSTGKEHPFFESVAEEEKKGLISTFLERMGVRRSKPEPARRRYKSLIDALAQVEGTGPDVAFLRSTKRYLKIFTGTLGGEPTYPIRGIAGPLALEEALKREITVEILFGPYFALGRREEHKLEEYFGEVYPLQKGASVRLELTGGDTQRSNGTAYINPEQVDASAQLLYQLAEEGDTVSPILSDPARIMLERAFGQTHNPEYVIALNRVLMYRGFYRGAAKVLETFRDTFEEVDSPPVKSEFFLYLGDAYFRSGELDKAAEVVGAAIKVQSENHVAYLLSGAIHQVQGDYTAAQLSLEKSLDLAPDVKITQRFLERTRRVQQLM